MTRRAPASVTVYLCLVLLVMLAFVLALMESARLAALQAMSQRHARTAVQMLFAGYTRPLADRYDLFALQGGDEDLAAEAGSYFDLNAGGEGAKPFALRCKSEECRLTDTVSVRDNDWQPLLDQMTRWNHWQLAGEGTAGLKALIDSFNNASGRDEGQTYCQEIAAESSAAEAEAVSASKEEKAGEDKPKKTVEDPRPGILRLMKQGILKLVMEDREISAQSMDPSDCSYQTGQEKKLRLPFDFSGAAKAVNMIRENEEGVGMSLISAGDEDLAVMCYLSDHFSALTAPAKREGAHCLAYEMEYLLNGRKTDRENLENTVTRLAGLRLVMNMVYLYSDHGQSAALNEAVALIDAAGLPAAGEVLRLLLILCWAGAESLVDCSALTQGKKVPMLKGDADWNLSFENLGALAKGAGRLSDMIRDGSRGFDYRQYLTLLLMTVPREKKLIRMTQLIEKNVRMAEGCEAFAFSKSVVGARLEGKAVAEPVFSPLAGQVSMAFSTTYLYVPREGR